MILLSRVDDRKSVLGLFNLAYELSNNRAEQAFPRLGKLVVSKAVKRKLFDSGQLVIDYDSPLKRLCDDFVPHRRTLLAAVGSFSSVYGRRNLSADQMRNAQLLSLSADPRQLLHVAQTDTVCTCLFC